jgi:hypothetical protein
MIDVAGEAEEWPADHQAEAHGAHLAQGHQTQVPRQPITAPRDRQSRRNSAYFQSLDKINSAVPVKREQF